MRASSPTRTPHGVGTSLRGNGAESGGSRTANVAGLSRLLFAYLN